MFPLSTLLYPHAQMPLHIFEPRYRALIHDCLAEDGEFGVVLIDRGSEVGGDDERFAMGTVAAITQASPLPDGRWVLMTQGTDRLRVAQWLEPDPYPLAMVERLDTASDPMGRDVGAGDNAAPPCWRCHLASPVPGLALRTERQPSPPCAP